MTAQRSKRGGSSSPTSSSLFEMILSDIVLFGITTSLYLYHQFRPHKQQDTNANELLGFTDTTNETNLERALLDGTTLNATENVCTVDENNIPTPHGHARSEMRLQKLWHRATYIIIRHEEEEQSPCDEKEDGDGSSSSEEDRTFLLVQRRSNIKDYCPGKLDPTPGGVVGFGEEYEVNAEREMMEEMNIDVTSTSASNNTMRKLFTFPYQDEKVKCWGGMFEVVYKGSLSDIKMQPEEVSEVLRLSITQIRKMAEEDPDDWMPDALHAVKLYLQRIDDEKMKRRLLKGYSSGDLDKYALRPKPQVIFFDCDDCLYFDGWKVANLLTQKIEEWCTTKKGLPSGEAYELYKKHGTALKGLLAEGHIQTDDTTSSSSSSSSEQKLSEAIDTYLREVHDLPIHDLIQPDPQLRKMILRLDPTIPKFIFTASVSHHAERCLQALGIDDLFDKDKIIDVKSCNLATKHSRESFEAAMSIAGVTDPESCIFLDDSLKNIEAARDVGWRSVLVGRVGRDCGSVIGSEHAEHEIDRIHQLPDVLPELFQ